LKSKQGCSQPPPAPSSVLISARREVYHGLAADRCLTGLAGPGWPKCPALRSQGRNSLMMLDKVVGCWAMDACPPPRKRCRALCPRAQLVRGLRDATTVRSSRGARRKWRLRCGLSRRAW
jgi:hypothetical protein